MDISTVLNSLKNVNPGTIFSTVKSLLTSVVGTHTASGTSFEAALNIAVPILSDIAPIIALGNPMLGAALADSQLLLDTVAILVKDVEVAQENFAVEQRYVAKFAAFASTSVPTAPTPTQEG